MSGASCTKELPVLVALMVIAKSALVEVQGHCGIWEVSIILQSVEALGEM